MKKKSHKRNGNKGWKIVLVVIAGLIILLVVVAILFSVSSENVEVVNEGQQLEENIKALQEEFGESADIVVEEGEVPDDPKEVETNLSAIPGYIQKSGADMENSNVSGMTLPYQIPDSSLQVVSLGQYTGPFIETGADIPVSNVMSLVVKNTGTQMIEYAEIELTVSEGETVLFKISALPAGTSVMVQESQQKEFSEEAVYTYNSVTEALSSEEKTMQEDKLRITGENGKITVENLTDSDMDKVYICYHTVSDGGVYLGGIAYRVSVEELKAGEEKSIESGHYLQGYSSILFAEID